MNELEALPRVDVRVEAFRKYESVLAGAIQTGTCEVSALELCQRRINARTFIARIRDALLGYNTYHYPSVALDACPRPVRMKFLEGPGWVLVKYLGDPKPMPASPFDQGAIRAACLILSTGQEMCERVFECPPSAIVFFQSLEEDYSVCVRIAGERATVSKV